MTVPKMEGEERPSKALKCDIPEVTVATLDSAPEGTAVFLVGKLRAVTHPGRGGECDLIQCQQHEVRG